jgi:hypothetical protein
VIKPNDLNKVIGRSKAMGKSLFKTALGIGVAVAAFAAADVGSAQSMGRDIQEVSIVYDVANKIVLPEGSTISTPRDIVKATFVKLNLRFILDPQSADDLQKSFDGSTAGAESSGCAPGDYGPMAMERDLFYAIVVPPIDGLSVRATIYPGDRAEHWANDVFCEFDPDYGENYAVASIVGFFYVIPRRRQDSVDVVLRAITPTQPEARMLQRD